MIVVFRRHINNVAILVTMIILLANCSSTRFLYTFVDQFIQDEITYFLDLNQEEKVLLGEQVSDMVNWHRISMLPSYATYLIIVADKIEKGQYGFTDINELSGKGQSLIELTVSGLTPYASKFLIEHQMVEDIGFIEKRMLMRQQERITELSKSEEILYKKRLKRLMQNFERFFGNLNDSQVTLLESHTSLTLGESRIRLHNRTLRQKVFIRFLKTQPTEEELTIYMEKLLLRGHLITNPSYKVFSEISLKRFNTLLVNMLAISSVEQRKKIINKLRNYAEDFKTISI